MPRERTSESEDPVVPQHGVDQGVTQSQMFAWQLPMRIQVGFLALGGPHSLNIAHPSPSRANEDTSVEGPKAEAMTTGSTNPSPTKSSDVSTLLPTELATSTHTDPSESAIYDSEKIPKIPEESSLEVPIIIPQATVHIIIKYQIATTFRRIGGWLLVNHACNIFSKPTPATLPPTSISAQPSLFCRISRGISKVRYTVLPGKKTCARQMREIRKGKDPGWNSPPGRLMLILGFAAVLCVALCFFYDEESHNW